MKLKFLMSLFLLLAGAVHAAGVAHTGDVNGDGLVDVADLRMIQRIVIGAVVPTAEQKASADVFPGATGNGAVTLEDYRQVQQWILAGQTKHSGLDVAQLGLVINDSDPYSVAVGEYYRVRRGVPAANIVHVNIPVNTVSLSRTAFATLKATVDAALPSSVQALAVAWTLPSRVECNSITSAFARGFQLGACDSASTSTCALNPPPLSLYYNSNSTQPFTDLYIRPAMMLAAQSIEGGKALIDRGIASDGTQPVGSAHIMSTSDTLRSLRATRFPVAKLGTVLSPFVNVQIDNANSISGTSDTLFYFQGLVSVPNIATNAFPPGAIADHLTSFGGMLTDSSQMSVLEFIAGGVTGTFGTVSEPCAYWQKFPDPAIVIPRYTAGETLIEAYWKSIWQTFQGEFVGEPLANPWRRAVRP